MHTLAPTSQRGAIGCRHVKAAPLPSARKQLRRLTVANATPTVETMTYAGLGLTALSFVGTFVVIPSFKQYFKEDIDWKDIYRELSQAGVKTITPEDAARKRGSVLVDVRLPAKFEAQHPAGAKGVPLYLPIQKWDFASTLRRVGFAFFGIYGTELNTSFADQMLLAVPRSKEVMVICEAGGSIENKSGTQFGFQSRSLKAVYYLRKAGYTKVLHVAGGTSRWFREGLPAEEGTDGAVALINAGLAAGSTGTRAETSSKRGSTVAVRGNGTKSISGTKASSTKGTSSTKSSVTSGSSGLRLPELPKLSLPKLPERVPVGTRSLRKSK